MYYKSYLNRKGQMKKSPEQECNVRTFIIKTTACIRTVAGVTYEDEICFSALVQNQYCSPTREICLILAGYAFHLQISR